MHRKTKNEKVKELLTDLENGVKELFDSQKYKDYLHCMSKFHKYSYYNTLLILNQRPDATLVNGYRSWQTKFGRYVKAGSKAICILAPIIKKVNTQYPDRGMSEDEEIRLVGYRVVRVFDISDTDGKPLATLVTKLQGTVLNYTELIKTLENIADIPVEYINTDEPYNGYYSSKDNIIVIKNGMSEIQTVKTLIHEIAHSILHNAENKRLENKDSKTKEVEAESVAYVVCNYLGIDTSEYSFGYIAGWSASKNLSELKNSLNIIGKTAKDLIDKLEVKEI